MSNIIHQQFGPDLTPEQILRQALDHAAIYKSVVIVTTDIDGGIQVAYSTDWQVNHVGLLHHAAHMISNEIDRND